MQIPSVVAYVKHMKMIPLDRNMSR